MTTVVTIFKLFSVCFLFLVNYKFCKKKKNFFCTATIVVVKGMDES